MTAISSGAHVLLTGVTGFVGKVVLAELLRRSAEFPVDTVYVLVRPKKGSGAAGRFEALRTAAVFNRLPAGWAKKVRVIEGDLALPGCGITPADRTLLAARLTHVLHVAASVEFDLPVAEAAKANIQSSLNVLELAREAPNMRAFVLTSTAYVSPAPAGARPVHEWLVPLPRSAASLYADIRRGVDGDVLMAETGHPNTYTLTKCIAEHLLCEQRGAVPLHIVRPSIISATWKHPFPGWIDSAAAFAGFVALIGAGHLRALAADGNTILDIVPCDEVADRILRAGFGPAPTADTVPIVHATAGVGRSPRLDECARIIVEFFRHRKVDRTPRLLYVGRRGRRFALHDAVLHRAPVLGAARWAALTGRQRVARKLEKLASKVEYLNAGFRYFTHNTFHFVSSRPIAAPEFQPAAYVRTVCRGVYSHLMRRDDTSVLLAGRDHAAAKPDVAWALRQPQGNWAVRSFGLVLRKGFRAATDQITFDRASFEAARGESQQDTRFVIVPTHRSYMDFLLCSYLMFSHPELGIPIPHIAAAEEFSRIPLLGGLFRAAHAFHLKRGVGREDAELSRQVRELTADGKALLFFIEGTRSRTRRYLPPRRGMLRALQSSGHRFRLLPVNVSYDRVAEEAQFRRELSGAEPARASLTRLAAWAGRLAAGDIRLGRVHVACGDPVTLSPDSDVHTVANRVMAGLQSQTACTTFHLRTFVDRVRIEGVDVAFLRGAVARRGGTVLESALEPDGRVDPFIDETLFHQFSHLFADDLRVRSASPLARHVADELYFGERQAAADEDRDDARIDAVVDALFGPIFERAARTLRVVEALRAGGAPVRLDDVCARLPGVYSAEVESVLRRLVSIDVLVPSRERGVYTWGRAARRLPDELAQVPASAGIAPPYVSLRRAP